MKNEFYYEAIFIEYAILEDRLASVLKYEDYLIVAVQNGKYIEKYKSDAHVRYSTDERLEILQVLRIVDVVKVYDVLSVETLKSIDFGILALGEDHKGKRFDDAIQWCVEHKK